MGPLRVPLFRPIRSEDGLGFAAWRSCMLMSRRCKRFSSVACSRRARPRSLFGRAPEVVVAFHERARYEPALAQSSPSSFPRSCLSEEGTPRRLRGRAGTTKAFLFIQGMWEKANGLCEPLRTFAMSQRSASQRSQRCRRDRPGCRGDRLRGDRPRNQRAS